MECPDRTIAPHIFQYKRHKQSAYSVPSVEASWPAAVNLFNAISPWYP